LRAKKSRACHPIGKRGLKEKGHEEKVSVARLLLFSRRGAEMSSDELKRQSDNIKRRGGGRKPGKAYWGRHEYRGYFPDLRNWG